jgi:toxin ParE1/3/4
VKPPRLVLADAAAVDILDQADWYSHQSAPTLSKRWENAVSAALLRVAKNPSAGNPCKFRSPELIGVRKARIEGFPKHLLFYRIRGSEIFIFRIVHGARDLEKML